MSSNSAHLSQCQGLMSRTWLSTASSMASSTTEVASRLGSLPALAVTFHAKWWSGQTCECKVAEGTRGLKQYL